MLFRNFIVHLNGKKALWLNEKELAKFLADEKNHDKNFCVYSPGDLLMDFSVETVKS